MSKYNEAEVLADLRLKGVMPSNGDSKLLEVPANALGNRSLGKLSYLKNYCGFRSIVIIPKPKKKKKLHNKKSGVEL